MTDEATRKINNDCLNPDKYKSVKSAGSKRMKTSSDVSEYIKPTPLPKSTRKLQDDIQ